MNQAAVLQALIRALEGLQVRYLIGGSVASSSRGIPRSTVDTDLVVRIAPFQTVPLVKALGVEWYLDAEFAGEAIRRGRAFNAIHIPSGHKFDLFPAVDPFSDSELERAGIRTLTVPGGNVQCFVATTEDMILAKLRWYRNGGETSERQWLDIMDMLAVNHDLDTTYLEKWAKQLGVSGLLQRAISQIGDPS